MSHGYGNGSDNLGGSCAGSNAAPILHGAAVGLIRKHGIVFHYTGGQSKQVLIRSYSDGIRVGCTFVSNEALREIWDMHTKYLKHEDFVQHQSGSSY